MRNKAFRRHNQKKAKAKTRPVLKRWGFTDEELDSDRGIVGTWANCHRKKCSCEMCSPSEKKYKRDNYWEKASNEMLDNVEDYI